MKDKAFYQSLLQPAARNRRQFLTDAGMGFLAATGLSQLAPAGAFAQGGPVQALSDTTPVKLYPLSQPSEPKPAPVPAPLDPEKRIGFALVGLGHLTLEELLPAFGQCKYAKPVALVSGDSAKAAQVAQQYGIKPTHVYNYQNFDNIRNNPDVQVVYIVLPNSMHEEFTIRAAQAGKDVLCEKPMANTSAQARRMIEACEKAGRKLMIAYRIQYEPKNNYIKELVRSRQHGKVRLIEMFNAQNIANNGQWRLDKELAGGGALPDIGIYCLNTARFLTGEEPEWVMASMYNTPGDTRFKEVDENVMWQMRFPGGTLVNAATSYSVHESRRYRCLADNGAWFGLDPAFSYHGLQLEMSQVREARNWNGAPQIPEKNQFALEMDHMAWCVLNNQKPYTPGEEGLQDHLIMEAIYRSAKEGKPVELSKSNKLDAFRGTEPKKES
jgi:predicted dehydrogenase